MNRFFRWLDSRIKNSYNNNCLYSPAKQSTGNHSGPNFEKEPTLNFLIHNANGGKIVEFKKFDRQMHEWNSTVYVITDKEDIGDLISKMITMELLKS